MKINDNDQYLRRLDSITFAKEDTYGYKKKELEEKIRYKEQILENRQQEKKKKIKNLKLFGKVTALSTLCIISGKTYKTIDSKIMKMREERAMSDYSSSMFKVIEDSKYFITDDSIVDYDMYSYHYRKIGNYIDEMNKEYGSILYQNNYIEAKDFYIATAIKYFQNNYGDMDNVIKYMNSVDNCDSLNDYVKMLGYSSVVDYTSSIYQINYNLKKDNIVLKKTKTVN